MADINEILDEREKTHGKFSDHAGITQSLKYLMHETLGWQNLNDMQRESLDMIVHKIGRILAGNPDEPDHWHDISGYAELIPKFHE